MAERWSPGCVNAADKARKKQKAKAIKPNLPNLGNAFQPSPVVLQTFKSWEPSYTLQADTDQPLSGVKCKHK